MKPDASGPSGSTGWWQLKYFLFSLPLPCGLMIQFHLRIFFRRGGWNTNYQTTNYQVIVFIMLTWWFGFLGSPYERDCHIGVPHCLSNFTEARHALPPQTRHPTADTGEAKEAAEGGASTKWNLSRLEVMSACGKFTTNKWTTEQASNCHPKIYTSLDRCHTETFHVFGLVATFLTLPLFLGGFGEHRNWLIQTVLGGEGNCGSGSGRIGLRRKRDPQPGAMHAVELLEIVLLLTGWSPQIGGLERELAQNPQKNQV